MSATKSSWGVISDDEDDDPIVNTFNVFLKPKLPDNKELVILQYTSKKADNPADITPPHVVEMRVKPESGFYEVDVPIDVNQAYDKEKGMAYGDALHKSNEAKKGGGHGLGAGFNLIPTSQSGARGGRRTGGNDGETQLSWQEAARRDLVLRKQTFGGNRSAGVRTKEMVGVFQGQNLHLTPISSIVRMTPQQHHIDAVAEQERQTRISQGGAGGSGGPAGGPGEKPGGRAIQMTIKAAMDNADGVVAESIIDRMHAIQKESWRHMDWAHENSDAAWEEYKKVLLLHPEDGDEGEQKVENVKGKGVATLKEDGGAPDLVEKVPHLRTGRKGDGDVS